MLYALVRRCLGILFKLLADLEVVGKENIPTNGPLIVATNHLHLIDPAVLMLVLPDHWRPVVFGASKYTRGWRWLVGLPLRLTRVIWVRRGEVDRQALREAIAVLQSGGILAMAPEGTRSKTGGLQKGKTGVAYLAGRTGVPILPVAHYGTEEFFRSLFRLQRPQLRVMIGEVMLFPILSGRGQERGQVLRANTEFLMRTLASFLPLEYRGFYG